MSRVRARRERGAVLLEFIVVGTALVTLIFGGLEFGRGLNAFIAIENSARDSARFRAARGNPGNAIFDDEARCWAVRSAPGYASSQPLPCDPTVPVADGGRCVLTTNTVAATTDGEEITVRSDEVCEGFACTSVTITYHHGLFFAPIPGIAPATDCLGRPSFPLTVTVYMRLE